MKLGAKRLTESVRRLVDEGVGDPEGGDQGVTRLNSTTQIHGLACQSPPTDDVRDIGGTGLEGAAVWNFVAPGYFLFAAMKKTAQWRVRGVAQWAVVVLIDNLGIGREGKAR